MSVEDTQPVQSDNQPVSQEPVSTETKAPEADLITRVSQFKAESNQEQNEPSSNQEAVTFDAELAKLETVDEVKTWAEQKHKDWEKGAQKKFQEAAAIRKEAEQLRTDLSTWTPEKVNALVNDPKFLKAAQELSPNQAASESEEDYSSLTDKEKSEITQLKQTVQRLSQERDLVRVTQEHSQLKQKYADYNSEKVNQLRDDLLTGQVHADNESLWKVINFEGAVNNAYKMGLQDRQTETKEKIDSVSVNGFANVNDSASPVRGEKEDNASWLKRLLTHNLAKSKAAH